MKRTKSGKYSKFILLIAALAVVTLASSCAEKAKPGVTSTTATTVASAGSTLDISTASTLPPGASVKVPKLVGRYFFHAKRILELQGLTYQALKTYKGGNGRRVLKQKPAAGTEVPGGYQISLVLQPPAPKGGRKITSLADATGNSSSSTDDAGAGGTGGAGTGTGSSSSTTSTTIDDGNGATTTTQGSQKPTTTTTLPEEEPKFAVIDSKWGSTIAEPTANFVIKNTGDAKAYCVSVSGTIRDSSGEVVGSSVELAAPTVVSPGERAYGRLVFSGLSSSTGTITYSFTWKNSPSGCSAIPIKVASKSLLTLPSGRKAISGTLKNNSLDTPSFAYVLAVAFGSDGKLLEVVLVEIDYLFLLPGQSTPYLAEFDYTRSMSSYTVISQGLLP